jgi:murein DD-endopeptidase MepM/ murein hydrolase activator NlpD
MSHGFNARRAALLVPIAAITAVIPLGLGSAQAWAEAAGVQQAPPALAGGSEYGAPAATVASPRPVVSELSVASTATAGRPPKVVLRIDEQGVGTVAVQVAVIQFATHARVIAVSLGWVRTGRTVTVTWPRGATLAPGSYQVSVSAHDHHGGTLLRAAHSSGVVSLTVAAPAPKPAATPKPATPTSAPAPSTPAGVPTPAQTATEGAVFPVQGPHNFGGPENLFGAPRDGYLHQGQDVLTAEGTPVVAPLAGTILTTSYQASGAGYYAVERTTVGFDFMFAHCQPESLEVATGQVVAQGQGLCKAGQTGDATAPHLDFEMWVGGWQAVGGEPINPLPYLQAWEQDGAS